MLSELSETLTIVLLPTELFGKKCNAANKRLKNYISSSDDRYFYIHHIRQKYLSNIISEQLTLDGKDRNSITECVMSALIENNTRKLATNIFFVKHGRRFTQINLCRSVVHTFGRMK